VLSYPLVNNGKELGSVSSYLTSQSWYNTAMISFSKTTPSPTVDDVRNFCNTLRRTVTDLGLNSFDANIIVRSVRDGMSIPSPVLTLMNTAACVK